MRGASRLAALPRRRGARLRGDEHRRLRDESVGRRRGLRRAHRAAGASRRSAWRGSPSPQVARASAGLPPPGRATRRSRTRTSRSRAARSLTVRGTPVHSGRRLLLTDGTAEVPFVDDGTGQVVARWPLAETVKPPRRRALRRGRDPRVAGHRHRVDPRSRARRRRSRARRSASCSRARKTPPRSRSTTRPPTITGSARCISSCARPLARSDACSRGSTARRSPIAAATTCARAIPFIKKSHAPIEIRVEAKDNDPITGPKWGASEAITVVPPDVGEPEARRLAALVRLRDALVDALAWRLASRRAEGARRTRREFLDREARFDDDDERAPRDDARHVVRGRARARSPRGDAAWSHAQGEGGRLEPGPLAEHHGARRRREGDRAHRARRRRGRAGTGTEGHARGREGARRRRRRSRGRAARSRRSRPRRRAGIQRMDAAVMVLGGGGRAMMRLGALGRDLGEIVEMDLVRVDRAREGRRSPAHGARRAGSRGAPPSARSFVRLARRSSLACRRRVRRRSRGARRRRRRRGERRRAGLQRGRAGAREARRRARRSRRQGRAGARGRLERRGPEAALRGGEEARAEGPRRRASAPDRRRRKRLVDEQGRGRARARRADGEGARAGQRRRRRPERSQRDLRARRGEARRGARALRSLRRLERREDGRRGAQEPRRRAEVGRGQARGAAQEAPRSARAPSCASTATPRASSPRRHATSRRRAAIRRRCPPAALEALHDAEQAAREAANALKQGDAEKGLQRQREAQQKLEQARDALGDGEPERERRGRRPRASPRITPRSRRPTRTRGPRSSASASSRASVSRAAAASRTP